MDKNKIKQKKLILLFVKREYRIPVIKTKKNEPLCIVNIIVKHKGVFWKI